MKKYLLCTLQVVILCMTVLGCKNGDTPAPQTFGYLSTACRLAAWDTFFPKFGTDNRLIEIHQNVRYFPNTSGVELYRTFEYENGELKRIVVPEITPTELFQEGRAAWTEIEYEYGKFGVTTIRKFGYEGIRNGKTARIETGRQEFIYNNSPKPVELLIYVFVNREVDDLRLRVRRKFEYDNKGNLSKEVSESIINGEVESTLPIKYFYDDYPNTTKVLSFFRDFDYLTAQAVFSTNNPIGVEYPGQVTHFPMTYDERGNVTSPYAIKWECN